MTKKNWTTEDVEDYFAELTRSSVQDIVPSQQVREAVKKSANTGRRFSLASLMPNVSLGRPAFVGAVASLVLVVAAAVFIADNRTTTDQNDNVAAEPPSIEVTSGTVAQQNRENPSDVSNPDSPADPVQDSADESDEPDTNPETESGFQFSESFTSVDALNRFEVELVHRDSNLLTETEWPGDYGPSDSEGNCADLPQTRQIKRGELVSREWILDSGWIYNCTPNGDEAKARLITAIGDTSGFSVGTFSPKQTFTDPTEIHWQASLADLGVRQWQSFALVPATNANLSSPPCHESCYVGTSYSQAGAIGGKWRGGGGNRLIFVADDEYSEVATGTGVRCVTCGDPDGPSKSIRKAFPDDPALTDNSILRKNIFKDNKDGTVTWSVEKQDGTFFDMTVPGSIPSGEYRLLFMDNNFTPDKDGPVSHSWHWDEIKVK